MADVNKLKISINLVDITRHNVGQLKLLNKCVLPVPYSEKHYQDTVSNWPRENPWCRLAYHNEYLVGAINSRIETYDPEDKLKRVGCLTPSEQVIPQSKRKKQGPTHPDTGKALQYRLHITTLSVLEAYRCGQIGTRLIQDVIATADKMHNDLDEIYVHVHVSNDKAIEFYKKFGFVEAGKVEGYYKNDVVTPPDSLVLVRTTVDPKANVPETA